MDLVTHSMLIVSAISITVGVVCLRVWLNRRSQLDFLMFAVACFSSAVYTWFEVGMATTDSTDRYGMLVRWCHIPAWFFFTSISLFIYFHLETGRRWLLWLIIGSRTVGTILNFAFPLNINFREITDIGHITLLGESLSYPIGEPNPWVLIQYVSFIALIVFSLDIMVTVWRAGRVRKALVYGGGIVLSGLTSFVLVATALWGGARLPAFAGPTIMFIVTAFAIDLNYDVRRSARLAAKLAKSEAAMHDDAESLRLSAAAADIGLWKRSLSTDMIVATDKWYEILGIEPGTKVTFQDYLLRIHPEDQGRVEKAEEEAVNGGNEYSTEYRIIQQKGDVRWMNSAGEVEYLDGKPIFLRGVLVDITKRKLAEQAAHELSRKLMDAQEKERARLARELHDDLSQSLAILSIQLQSLVSKPQDPAEITKHVDTLTQQIQQLSSDVHRISHELHPSKLTQLGLEAALRGFCRETQAAHGVKIGFEASNVPHSVPSDISLCLYRIGQEALQNVVKHSGASLTNVALRADDGVISLLVSDNGSGFDAESVRSKDSLGLISMQERIRAVNGTITIESVPDAGTKIEASVPLNTN